MKLTKYPNEEIVQLFLPFRGQVGAGTVVPFTGGGMLKLKIPSKYKKPFYSIYQACGDSFVNEGIMDGDWLICREKFEKSEVTKKRLVIVKIPSEDLTLKRITLIGNGTVKLESANRKYKPLFFPKELIQIIALVDVSYREYETE
ncbi:MAG TPA: S24 family peptidase [Pyrinomonadaceae bacterium]|jgi:SOS-response transcriptional repressor LexA